MSSLCLQKIDVDTLRIIFSNTVVKYRIAGIFRGYKFSQIDHYKGFRGFYFRDLSSSLLAYAHINMQPYLHTVSLESTPSLYRIGEALCPPPLAERLLCRPWSRDTVDVEQASWLYRRSCLLIPFSLSIGVVNNTEHAYYSLKI